MSVLIAPKRPVKKNVAPVAESAIKAPAYRSDRRDEAPDRGDRIREASESRPSRATEAPDAGYRRSSEDHG